MQRINQNVSTIVKLVFSLPSNRLILPAFHMAIFVLTQAVLVLRFHGDPHLIAVSLIGVLVYLFAVRYYAGRRVSFATIRRVSATHSFFLLVTFFITALFVALGRPMQGYISALSADFSLSYVILRGEFLERRAEPLLGLLVYFFFLLLPVYRAILRSLSVVELYFWAAAFAITALFFYAVDRFTRRVVGVKLSNLMQRVLDAWIVEYADGFEELMESFSSRVRARTYCLSFEDERGERTCIVVPPVHPGPFRSAGSANITEVLCDFFRSRGYANVVVLHSPSNHDMNLPSRRSVQEYLRQLDSPPAVRRASLFTVFSKENQFFQLLGVSSDAFDFVIVNPRTPMDDFPMGFMQRYYEVNSRRDRPLILVDAHNKLSTFVNSVPFESVLHESFPEPASSSLYLGFRSLLCSGMNEIGACGAQLIRISDGRSELRLVSVDSNNSTPQASEIVYRETGYLLVTTDTHVIKTITNKKGYWAFGELTDPYLLVKRIREAGDDLRPAKAELLEWDNEINVLGKDGLDKLRASMAFSISRFRYYGIALLALFIAALIY
ncbi:MAG: DUF2070 family protein [Nitrososphaeria archaeon]